MNASFATLLQHFKGTLGSFCHSASRSVSVDVLSSFLFSALPGWLPFCSLDFALPHTFFWKYDHDLSASTSMAWLSKVNVDANVVITSLFFLQGLWVTHSLILEADCWPSSITACRADSVCWVQYWSSCWQDLKEENHSSIQTGDAQMLNEE